MKIPDAGWLWKECVRGGGTVTDFDLQTEKGPYASLRRPGLEDNGDKQQRWEDDMPFRDFEGTG